MNRQLLSIVVGFGAAIIPANAPAHAEATKGVAIVIDTTGGVSPTELAAQIAALKDFLADPRFFTQDGEFAMGLVPYGPTGAPDLDLIDLTAASIESELLPALDAIADQFRTGSNGTLFPALDRARAMLSARSWAPGSQVIVHVGQAGTHPQPRFIAAVTDASTTEQPILSLGFSLSAGEVTSAILCDPGGGTNSGTLSFFLQSQLGFTANAIDCGPGPGPGPGPGCSCSDDGLFCTDDFCSGGVCTHPAKSCDDSNLCTDDSCNETTNACVHTSNFHLCNDSDACTTSSQCNASNICAGTGNLNCDDSLPCTTDTCDSDTGCVNTPNNAACDDGNVCTTDICDLVSGCVNTNNTVACDDGDPCTTGDTCAAGACVAGPPTDCDDGNVCTDDSCDLVSGCVNANNTAACDDGDPCTTGDTCEAGACVAGPPTDCDDGNVCTDDSCDLVSGCVNANNTAACDDGDACTTADTCAAGACVGGPPLDCDDGFPCTVDSCIPASGCASDPSCCAGPLDTDCNSNGIVDSCDIAFGTSDDDDGDGVLNECEPGVDENGFVQHWAVLGTFVGDNVFAIPDPITGGCGYTELNIDPSVGDSTQGLVWTSETALLPTGVGRSIDFEAIFAQDVVTAYAHTYIYNPVSRSVRALIGSDDNYQLYVDGVQVWEWVLGARPSLPDDDSSDVFSLSEGWHRVMVHSANDSTDASWNFMLRFVADYTGAVLTDLTATRLRTDLPADRGIAPSAEAAGRPPIMLDWLALGPFDTSGCDSACIDDNLAVCIGDCDNDVDVLARESGGAALEYYLQPVTGEIAAGTDKTWVSLRAGGSIDFSDADHLLDLNDFYSLGAGEDNKTVYLHTYCNNFGAAVTAQIVIGASDAAQVWINGLKMFRDCHCVQSTCDEFISDTFVIEPGINAIRVRIDGSDSEWGGVIRLVDAALQQPLEGVSFSTEGDTAAAAAEPDPDCNGDGIPDGSEVDCNANGVPDVCEINSLTAFDCDGNGVPDDCQVNASTDCNGNGLFDACELPDPGQSATPGCTDGFASWTFTTDADFNMGTLLNVNINHDAQDPDNDYLQVNEKPLPNPLVWIACSGRGTIVKIDTITGEVLGEYWSAPNNHGKNPSRTTVDLNGWVWAANRAGSWTDPATSIRYGSVVRIAGDEVDCEDRDLSGSIETSKGLGCILPWGNIPNPDPNGRVTTAAADECLVNFVAVAGTHTRLVAVDQNNDVWVGSYAPDPPPQNAVDHANVLEKLQVNGFDVTRVPGTRFVRDDGLKCGGYGGLIDGAGVIWSAKGTLRYDPSTGPTDFQAECLKSFHFPNGETVNAAYGVALDPVAQTIWFSEWEGPCCRPRVHELNPATGQTIKSYCQGLDQTDCTDDVNPNRNAFNGQGIAVDAQRNVWVAEAGSGNRVLHLAPYPNINSDHVPVGNVGEDLVLDLAGDGVCQHITPETWSADCQSAPTPRTVVDCAPEGTGDRAAILFGPTGVAVDPAGRIWVTEMDANRVSRINLFPELTDAEYTGRFDQRGLRVGQIDMQIELGDGCTPYNYSDMTGFQALASVQQGTWRLVQEGNANGTVWTTVRWNEDCIPDPEPGVTTIQVDVRSSLIRSRLGAEPWVSVAASGASLTGIFGRYLEVKVTLDAAWDQANFITPVLCDLTIESRCPTDCNENETPDTCDISSGQSSDTNNNSVPDDCELNPVVRFLTVTNGQIDDPTDPSDTGITWAYECAAVGIDAGLSDGGVAAFEWDLNGDGFDPPAGPDATGVQFIHGWLDDSNGGTCAGGSDCQTNTVWLRALNAEGFGNTTAATIDIYDTEITAADIRIEGRTALALGEVGHFTVLINQLCDDIGPVHWDPGYDPTPAVFVSEGTNAWEFDYAWTNPLDIGTRYLAVRVTEADETPNSDRPVAYLEVTIGPENPDVVLKTTDLAVETRYHYYDQFPAPGTPIRHSAQMRVVNMNEMAEVKSPLYVAFTDLIPVNTVLPFGAAGPLSDPHIEILADGEPPLIPGAATDWVEVTWDVPEDATESFSYTATAYAPQLPPIFEQVSPVPVATEGEQFVLTVHAEDPEGSPVYYRLGTEGTGYPTDPPNGMIFDTQTGTMAWTPNQTAAANGTGQNIDEYDITFLALDGYAESSMVLTIKVEEVNVPPTIDSTPDTTAVVDSEYSYTLQAHDDDGDPVTLGSLVLPPSAFFVENTGVLTWTPTNGNTTFPISLTATDDTTPVVQAFEVMVSACNPTPVIKAIGTLSATEGLPFSKQVSLETSPAGTAYYSLDLAPEGMAISNTGLIEWTPSFRSSGIEIVRVLVSDDPFGFGGCGDVETFDITVTDRHTDPVINPIADAFAIEGVPFSQLVFVTDEDGDLSHSYTLIESPIGDPPPAGMTIEPWYGLIEWSPSQKAFSDAPAADGQYTVWIRVTDSSNRWDEQSFNIFVTQVDVPPTIDSRPNRFAIENGRYEYVIEAMDLDCQSLNFVIESETPPPAMVFDDATRTLSWDTPNDTAAFNSPYFVRITVDDGANNFDSQSFDLHVVPTNTPPVFDLPLPCDLTVFEGELYVCEGISVSDADNDEVAGIIQDTLTFSLEDPPDEMYIHPVTGLLFWYVPADVPSNDSPQDRSVTVRVSDGDNITETPLTISVSHKHQPPLVLSTPIFEAEDSQDYSYQIIATSVEVDDDTLEFTKLSGPPTLSVTQDGGLVTWQPNNTDVGDVHLVQIEIDDLVDPVLGKKTHAFPIFVSAGANEAPTITTQPDFFAQVDVEYVYEIIADDADSTDTLSITLRESPAGVDFTPDPGDDRKATITWTPTAAQIETHVFWVRVDDNKEFIELGWSVAVSLDGSNQPPQFTSTPVTQAKTGVPYRYEAEALDSDSSNNVLTYSLLKFPGDMMVGAMDGVVTWDDPQEGGHEVELRVDDGRGGSATQSFTLVVSEDGFNDGPTIVTLSETSHDYTSGVAYKYTIIAVDPDNDTITYSFLANPAGMTINVNENELPAPGLVLWDPGIDQKGEHFVKIKADDGHGAAHIQYFWLTVFDGTPNTNPRFTSTPAQVAVVGSDYVYDMRAEDDEQPESALTFEPVAGPAGFDLDPSDPYRILWPTEEEDVGTHRVAVRVSDNVGGWQEQWYDLVVSLHGFNRAPDITSAPSQIAVINQQYTYQVRAFDPDDDPLSFSLDAGPAGMLMDSPTSGLIRWTPPSCAIATYQVVVRVEDGLGGEVTQSFDLAVSQSGIATNRPPTIISAPLTRALDAPAYIYTYPVVASDPDGDTRSYALLVAPQGMTIDTGSGEITWPGPLPHDCHEVEVLVSDGRGGTATQKFGITVSATGTNHAPRVASSPPDTAAVNSLYAYPISVFDEDGDSPTFTLEMKPAGAILNPSQPGEVIWTPNPAQVGTHEFLVRITDGTGGCTSQQWFVTASPFGDNHAPRITSTPIGVSNLQGYQYSIHVDDPDGDAPFYSLVTAPIDMTINPFTGDVHWATPVIGHHDVVVDVHDGRGGWDEQEFRLAVSVNCDNHPPRIRSVPPLLAAADGQYIYDVEAADEEVAALTYTQLDPQYAGMSFATGSDPSKRLRWDPVVSANGTYDVNIRVSETLDANSYVDQSFAVTVSPSGDNEAPRIVSTPILTAVEGGPYTYIVCVEDDGAGPLTFAVEDGPPEMSFVEGSTTGVLDVLSWTSGVDLGEYAVDIKVTDDQNGSTIQSFTIQVLENQPPQIVSAPNVRAIVLDRNDSTVVGDDYAYQVVAFDPDGVELYYDLIVPAGNTMQIDANGSITWFYADFWARLDSTPGVAFVNETIEVVVNEKSDFSGLEDRQTFTLQVVDINAWDLHPPKVTVSTDLFNDVGGIGQPITISVTVVDDTGILNQSALLEIKTPGPGGVLQDALSPPVTLPLDADGQAFFVFEGPTHFGGFQVIATAIDLANTVGVGRTDFFVPGDGETPDIMVEITSPELDEEVGDSEIMIEGWVTTDHIFKYTLAYRPLGTEDLVVFKTDYTTVGAVDQPGVLGMLDTTQLVNGIYEVQLEAIDIAGFSKAFWTQFAITNKIKVGNLQLAFTDLNVALPGIPATITRSYDSRNKQKGDFGVGWKLGLDNMKLEENVEFGRFWFTYLSGWQCPIAMEGVKYVTVTWPDDRVEVFSLILDYRVQSTTGCAIPLDVDGVDFVSASFGTSLLSIPSGDQPEFMIPETGTLGQWDGPPPWDPLIYHLDAADGTRYVFRKVAGTRIAKVYKVIDRNGNELTFTKDGIVHSASDLEYVVAYERDDQNRIVEIKDPMAQADPTRGTLRYDYDANGDLVRFTNQVDEVTTFAYDDQHNMFEIIGPDGRLVAHNVFDDQGRLIAHVDTEGNWITYTHDPDARTEVVTDRLGHQKIYIYDADANVIEQHEDVKLDGVNATTLITKFEYDERGNQTKLILPDGSDNLFTERTYDARDNLETDRDKDGNITTYKYRSDNLVEKVTDPLGNVTDNEYDSNGNLTRVTRRNPAGDDEVTEYTYVDGQVATEKDPLGFVTVFEYNASGYLQKQIDPRGYESSFEYDACGRLIRETRPVGPDGTATATTDFVYDDAGRRIQQTAAQPDPIGYPNVLGVVTTMTYTPSGRTETVSTSDGTISHEYDFRGNLVKTTFDDGSTVETGFDAEGRQVWTKDRDGVVTAFKHDELGRAFRTYLPDDTPDVHFDGPITETVFDRLGRVVEKRIADNDSATRFTTTTYSYTLGTESTNASQSVTSHVTVDGVVQSYTTTTEFDGNRNTVRVTDARNNVTDFVYDFAGRLVKTIQPDDLFTQVTYDRGGRKIAGRDRAGLVTQFAYDNLGRLESVTDAEVVNGVPGITQYLYDAAGNVLTQTDANGHTTSMIYDALGQMRSRTLPDGALAEAWSTYDVGNRLLDHTDFNDDTTTLTYGAEGRLETKALPATDSTAASIVNYTYTPKGRRSSAGGDTFSYFEDPVAETSRGLLREETKVSGQKLKYDYDGRGNRTRVTTFKTNGTTVESITDYAYDELNRLVLVTEDPGGTPRVTRYRYDEVGNRSLVRYPNNTCTRYVYDALNRLTQLTNRQDDAAGDCVNGALLSDFVYTLGPAGNRTQVDETIVEADGTTRLRSVTYEYDNLYRLVEETVSDNTVPGAQQRTVRTFTFDRVGNRTTEVVAEPSGTTEIAFTYDVNDRLETKEQTFTVAANLQPQDVPRFANAGPTPSRWAGQGLITFGVVTLGAFLAPLALLWSRRRRIGQGQCRRNMGIRSMAAVLIPLMVVGPEHVLALHNDAMAHRAMSEALTAAAIAQAGGDVSWTFTYDNNGNLNERAELSADRIDIYHYDAENRLVARDEDDANEATPPAPVEQVAYDYDADGIRVSMTDVAGVLTTYLTDKNRDYAQVLVETNDPGGPGEAATKYTYGDDLISQDRVGTLSYYHYDGQLSVRQLTDSPADPTVTPASITDSYTFEAFGELSDATSDDGTATVNNYLYTGEQYDPNVGFYYLRARYYDQSNGRFVTRDTFGGSTFDPMSLHKYLYVNASPIDNIDPTGLFTIVQIAVTSAIMGVLVGLVTYAITGSIRTAVAAGLIAVVITAVTMILLSTGSAAAAMRQSFQAIQRILGRLSAHIRRGIRLVKQRFERALREVSRGFVPYIQGPTWRSGNSPRRFFPPVGDLSRPKAPRNAKLGLELGSGGKHHGRLLGLVLVPKAGTRLTKTFVPIGRLDWWGFHLTPRRFQLHVHFGDVNDSHDPHFVIYPPT